MDRPQHGGNRQWAAAVAGCAPEDLLDFSASLSPLGPPTGAIAAIQAGLAELSAYPHPDYGILRSAIARFHQVDADWILPGNGAAELLTWAGRDLAGCGRVYLPTPAFGDYGRSLQAFQAPVQPWPLPIQQLFADVGTTVAPGGFNLPELSPTDGILINNPHNPSGYLFSAEPILKRLASGGLVVVDEAFMDFLPPDRQQSVIDWVSDYPNLVVVRSLTKFYGLAGLRLGYAILHPDRRQRWQTWRDPWPVNSLAAAVGATILEDRAFQQQTWDWLVGARRSLFEGLRALPGLEPYLGAANFLLVRCVQESHGGELSASELSASELSASELQLQLLRHHRILIRDCLSFPELGDRYFRVAVRLPDENQRLLQGLQAALEGRV